MIRRITIESLEITGTKVRKRQKSRGAKMNREDVVTIRDMYSTGQYTMVELASLCNCCESNISRVISGNTWKGLPGNKN